MRFLICKALLALGGAFREPWETQRTLEHSFSSRSSGSSGCSWSRKHTLRARRLSRSASLSSQCSRTAARAAPSSDSSSRQYSYALSERHDASDHLNSKNLLQEILRCGSLSCFSLFPLQYFSRANQHSGKASRSLNG